MKKSIVITALVALSVFAFQATFAQAHATQTLTLAVNAVYRISISGSNALVTLTITGGTAGSNVLTPVSNASTTYNITQNSSTAAKITAGLNPPLGAGYSLKITLASTKGTSVPAVDIFDGTAKDVVTAMVKGADQDQVITYVFGADASAGILSSTTETVTLTLTN